MIRVVVDTVVFVRCLINPFGAASRLILERAGEYRLVVSKPLVAEALKVFQRPELTRKYRGLGTRNMHTILSFFEGAEAVELDAVPAVSRDPQDDKVLATALAGSADYIVSEDLDLLDLKEYEGIPIVHIGEFLRVLDRQHG